MAMIPMECEKVAVTRDSFTATTSSSRTLNLSNGNILKAYITVGNYLHPLVIYKLTASSSTTTYAKGYIDETGEFVTLGASTSYTGIYDYYE